MEVLLTLTFLSKVTNWFQSHHQPSFHATYQVKMYTIEVLEVNLTQINSKKANGLQYTPI